MSILTIRFTGSLIVRVVRLPTSDTPLGPFLENPTLSGLFVDAP